jgi:hypothetical protein
VAELAEIYIPMEVEGEDQKLIAEIEFKTIGSYDQSY